MQHSSRTLLALCAGIAMLASGCGGGGADGGSGTPAAAPAPAAAQITGTAAVGNSLANAPVAITNGSGGWPCVESSVTTTALGAYTCTLQAGQAAPFFVVVTDPTGNTPPLVSVTTTTPPAGTALTLNVTPLTTAIVAQAGGADALAVVKSGRIDASALASVTSNVVAQLQPVLSSIDAPAGYDPFTTAITAATPGNTGNTADLVLDVVKVTTDPSTGAPALSTIADATPVPIGSTTPLAPVDSSVDKLTLAMQLAAQSLDNCFALPVGTRVVSRDETIPSTQGGPEVQQVATQCQNIVSQAQNGGGLDFLQNGYSAGQFLYAILTSDQMTNAQFSVPQLMAYYPADPAAAAGTPASYDRAVVNIQYVDGSATHNPGNLITVAARIPHSDTSARPTDWWLVGNQQPVDTAVRMMIRSVQQMNAASTQGSYYQSGVQFAINAYGPGSIRGGQALTLARVTGPGLPPNGLVFRVSSSTALTTMDLWNKTGSLTAGSQCGNGTMSNCPLLWFERTVGTTGTDATTLAPNFNSFLWAQPADHVDPTLFRRPAKYRFELFYGSNVGTADVVVEKTLLSDLVLATQGHNLAWNSPGPRLLAALDPNGSLAGTQAGLTIDWTQNPVAEQIGNALAMIDPATGTFGPPVLVQRGATSVTFANQTVPAFSPTASRAFLLVHRMLDGSNKSVMYRFN